MFNNAHLQEKLKDERFQGIFDEEEELVRIGVGIADARAKLGISQTELPKRAKVAQQQASQKNRERAVFVSWRKRMGIEPT